MFIGSSLGSLSSVSSARHSPQDGGNGNASPSPGGSRARELGVISQFSPESLQKSSEFQEGLAGQQELTQQEQQQVTELQQRDREVRNHEQAHIAAAGQYAQGGAQYEYTTGPDGKRYATSGEVSISVSPENTPEKTIQKMRIVRKAALAPAEPSAQDRRVAAQASQEETRAQRELAELKQTNSSETGAGTNVSNQELIEEFL